MDSLNNIYTIPKNHYFRIHHSRPRFKDDVENVLIYVATKLCDVPSLSKKEYAEEVRKVLYQYPGNAIKTKKTIDNWRTEISTFFGFTIKDGDFRETGYRAYELAINQDLVEFFKNFLYTFQYPGGHIKSDKILEQIEHGIKFKPAQSILKIMIAGRNKTGKNVYLTKAETCYCIFNDTRVTKDHEDPLITWNRIEENRINNVKYDETGDVIRYAGDIIDYMRLANLLKTYDYKHFYLNKFEEESILKFANSKEWFSDYDNMIKEGTGSYEEIKACEKNWFDYVNRDFSEMDFSTDILAFIASSEDELQQIKEQYKSSHSSLQDDLTNGTKEIEERIASNNISNTKDIGDMGEFLVHGHECMRIKNAGREDLVHLIKRIPTQFALGYDINSVEADNTKRLIEVKTTISTNPINFNTVHLTPNEWATASTFKDRYYIYRLMLNAEKKELFVLQDPVGLYKKGLINMTLSDGADITFNPDEVGRYEELLQWKN